MFTEQSKLFRHSQTRKLWFVHVLTKECTISDTVIGPSRLAFHLLYQIESCLCVKPEKKKTKITKKTTTSWLNKWANKSQQESKIIGFRLKLNYKAKKKIVCCNCSRRIWAFYFFQMFCISVPECGWHLISFHCVISLIFCFTFFKRLKFTMI